MLVVHLIDEPGVAQQKESLRLEITRFLRVEDGAWDRMKGAMPEFYEASVASHPTGRMGTPEEVADVAVFLCSPAASWVTGANVVVDGGFTKRISY